MFLISWCIERISQIGQIPLCNGIASRAPHLFGYCFILCYRCTFILLFFIGTLCFLQKKKVKSIKYVWILLLPMIIDGSLQTFFGFMSTNFRRSFTGALFGLALAYIVDYLFLKIDNIPTAL